MAGLVGIHVRSPVQALGSFRVIRHSAVKIEQLKQSLAIIAFAVGGIKELAHELQKIGRTPMLGGDILHHRHKGPPVSAVALKLLQLTSQSHRLSILLRIHEPPHQIRDFLLP